MYLILVDLEMIIIHFKNLYGKLINDNCFYVMVINY